CSSFPALDDFPAACDSLRTFLGCGRIRMYTKDTVTPLTINTKNHANGRAGVFSAAFHYTEEPSLRQPANTHQTTTQRYRTTGGSSAAQRTQTTGMNGYPSTAAPSGMYVRALYDYEADDRTSLSFRQGDTIQVITQLASGWWDGIINGVRGWFPSNYCVVVTGPDDNTARAGQPSAHAGDVSGSGTEDEYEDDEASDTNEKSRHDGSHASLEGDEEREQEEAAFWIPQATPDGRLFYFNTLTGVSTMELPLETPTSINESGPRDRMNIKVPDQTRPPPEMMAGGFEQVESEIEDSASELGDSQMLASRVDRPGRRRSYISDGASPAASTDSLNASPVLRNGRDPTEYEYSAISSSAVQQVSASMSAMGNTSASFTSNPLGQVSAAAIPRSFFDDSNNTPKTWNKLVENIRRSVELYIQAINNADRSEYVRRAEDISDHLRMLLAAASGTTDNHSGNPSVISTNKALYPHFRDMMSRFSKLVLSSHIAAADFPAPDSYSKCLQEAEGVLHGVYGYVEVARSQRGEEIPRLVPGFVLGSNNGGSWQNNNLEIRDPMLTTSFMDQDDSESFGEPNVALDSGLLERMDDLKRMIVSSIRRLEDHLVITEKLVTARRHKQLANTICTAAGKVIDFSRPWMTTVESIDLAPLRSSFQSPQLNDFGSQKQRVYDLIMQLVVACQAVAAPLGDEWAESRGDPLDVRLSEVRSILRQLETSTSQVGFSLQLLLDVTSQENSPLQQMKDAQIEPPSRPNTDGGSAYSGSNIASPSKYMQRPQLAEMGQSQSFTEGIDVTPDKYHRSKDNSKVEKFFGELPSPMLPGRDLDDTPVFLRLDLEGEISYDDKDKSKPPQLRGGTLMALVEQLTRHDRLDSDFNTTFLLTYRSFTTASELFELLVKRFSIQPPRGISEEDYKMWVDKKQRPIRFRVVNILKSWFDNYWMENNDPASRQLLQRVYSFAKDSIATTNTPGSGPLMHAVEQRLRGQDTTAKILVPTPSTAAPTPIIPKNMKKLKFLDIDATEFARQLTIIESRLYGKIKPTECLNKTWQKKVPRNEPEPAANVKALILHSNQLTNWVAEMILTQSDVRKRVVVIKHFVSVADKCRSLNNFSTLTSIISALGTAPIHRLQRTWAQVNTRTMSILETLRRLMGSTKNFGEYRVYLTDLTFIEDGISSVIKRTNLINFAKRAKTADVIRDIQDYQNVPYPLKPVMDLQDYILSNMQAAGDVHEMYEKSLQIEPREREDEKITRLVELGLVG
ncbi:MAG: hypothetical protein Q9191_006437, partial [Dirinaria sp. TL-2023a]